MALLDALPGITGSFDGYAMALGRSPVKVAAQSLTRTKVTLQNSGISHVLVGTAATVAADSEFILRPGESLTITAAGDVWAVARLGAAEPVPLSVWVEK